MISGNNGILTKTTDAKKANEQGIEGDRVRLAAQSALIDGEGKIDLTDNTNAKGNLKKALIEEFGTQSPVVQGYTSGTGTVIVGEKKYSVTTTGGVEEIVPQWTLTTDNNLNGEPDVGDLITSKKKTTEKFYVIGKNGDTVLLLAKYNLKKVNDSITLLQDTDTETWDDSQDSILNGCAFSESGLVCIGRLLGLCRWNRISIYKWRA